MASTQKNLPIGNLNKMLKKNKRNRPRLKTLIVFCVIIALITFAIVVGVKLYNKNNGNGTTANITYNV